MNDTPPALILFFQWFAVHAGEFFISNNPYPQRIRANKVLGNGDVVQWCPLQVYTNKALSYTMAAEEMGFSRGQITDILSSADYPDDRPLRREMVRMIAEAKASPAFTQGPDPGDESEYAPGL